MVLLRTCLQGDVLHFVFEQGIHFQDVIGVNFTLSVDPEDKAGSGEG
jgi:hypothetical protein